MAPTTAPLVTEWRREEQEEEECEEEKKKSGKSRRKRIGTKSRNRDIQVKRVGEEHLVSNAGMRKER